jgi:dTDP-4-dehydrorhamnose 3,5-epimerase
MPQSHYKFSDVLVFSKPKEHRDGRGYFKEVFKSWGPTFVQENESYSKKGTIRGLHFQNPNPQGKLVSTISGEIYDLFVDLRKNSETFGLGGGVTLTPGNSIYVPEGFAHGFVALQDSKIVYRCTDFYDPESEKSLYFFDPNIDWGYELKFNDESILMSKKDLQAKRLNDFTEQELF